MSDGPHKSLPMRLAWKRLAERADNVVFSPEEVSDALPSALKQDWIAEVPKQTIRRLQEILGDDGGGLFGDCRIERLDAERAEVAGHPFACVLVDCVVQAVVQGLSGDEALMAAGTNALSDRAARGVRQVEEHYKRKASHGRADHVRERLEHGVTQTDLRLHAKDLLGSGRDLRALAPTKKHGLDDGVRL